MNGYTWGQRPRDQNIEKKLFGGINTGINFDKYDDIPIDAKGTNVPASINRFGDLQLHPWLVDNIALSGYDKPTPIQKCALPVALSGRDLMACAETGSGKTAAFLLPIIDNILRRGSSAIKSKEIRNARTCQYPAALVMAPTRELAMQIYQEVCKFTYRLPIEAGVLYGGQENRRTQVDNLRAMRACSIIVATPGRLKDIMKCGNVSLSNCRYLVLDEADRMLDMGFEPQIREIVEQSNMPKTGNRRTMMFSATFPKPIQQLARDFLVPDYVFATVGRVGRTSENITQNVILVTEREKKVRVMDLLDESGNKGLTLIFTETKRAASELTDYLYKQAYDPVAIHGDMSQAERERSLSLFRSGLKPVLVATNVAARGLDIPNVTHVINYDLPGDIDDYVHRIGRTGRVGNIGKATSFFSQKNVNIARDLVQLIKDAKQPVPPFLLDSMTGSYSSFSRTSPPTRSYNSYNSDSSKSHFASAFNGFSGSRPAASSGDAMVEVTGQLSSLFTRKH